MINNNPIENLKSDFPASIVVFFVAIPLCLGIALASGAPLFSGLIAGIIGGIVVGAISGSQIGVSGPAAGLAAIVLSAITSLGGFENFLVAVVLGGIIQLILELPVQGSLVTTSFLGHQRNAHWDWTHHYPKTDSYFFGRDTTIAELYGTNQLRFHRHCFG